MTLGEFATVAIAAAVALAFVMSAGFAVQRVTRNSGWIDVTWSFGVGAVGAVVALLPFGPHGVSLRQMLVASLSAAWCLRLGAHIAGRTRTAADDPRYRALIEQWGDDAPRRLFFFLQSQAAVGWLLVMSILLAARHPAPGLRVQDWLGLAIWLVGVGGAALADRQLRKFRSNPNNHGKVCEVGLWHWSRHPNYFFEWVAWCSYAVIALDLTGAYWQGWLALAAPVCMYWVLVHASGIPPLEAHMLKSRGELFRRYQARTSAFVPWPRG